MGIGAGSGPGAFFSNTADEFDLMNVPVVTQSWVPPQLVGINGTTPTGFAVADYYFEGYWTTTQVGNAFTFFGGDLPAPQGPGQVSFASYNGPDPVAVQKSMQKFLVGPVRQAPKKMVEWYLCANGEFDNIRNYTLEGFSKGAIVGGIAGVEGGPPGIALGALGGGVEGWFGGSALGIVATAVCKAGGLNGPR
jgi:hypothetical protein